MNAFSEMTHFVFVFSKIRNVLTARCVKFFRDQMKRDIEEYKMFYSKYSAFFKEGILRSTDTTEKVKVSYFKQNLSLKICLNVFGSIKFLIF